MREILFRAKDLDNNWVAGEYMSVPGREDLCGIRPREIINVPKLCKSATVGQYTGLTDKNGRKIFEGDILDCGDRVVYVKWHEGCASWDSQFARYKGHRCSNGVDNAEWKFRAEVIGNIHDNPELLEVAE